jgi:F0F1-type ATP synthase membrane subunit b/b'
VRKLWQLLSLCVTPLCLAVLLCEPRSLAQIEQGAEGAKPSLEGGHDISEEHLDENPIHNWSYFGYRNKDIEGRPWQEGEHRMPPPFSMALLNFAIFAVLMYRMAAPSIIKATRERHDAIAKALAEGTRLRDEAQARLTEYEGKLAKLQGEIEAMVASIRAEADAEKKRIILEAEQRAERMRRDAEQQIQAELQRVRIVLEREAVEAAVTMAERILKEKTTEADQRLLADRFVKGLSDATARRRAGQ